MKFKINKDNLTFYSIILFFIILFLFLINHFSYFDPLNLCYIKIDGDIIRGEESTIHKALNLIKKENKKTYKDICKYVDVISEKNCVVADWKVSPDDFAKGLEFPGCYVRGSKTIYLKANDIISDEVINFRKNDIIKYSTFSKDFWEKQ